MVILMIMWGISMLLAWTLCMKTPFLCICSLEFWEDKPWNGLPNWFPLLRHLMNWHNILSNNIHTTSNILWLCWSYAKSSKNHRNPLLSTSNGGDPYTHSTLGKFLRLRKLTFSSTHLYSSYTSILESNYSHPSTPWLRAHIALRMLLSRKGSLS